MDEDNSSLDAPKMGATKNPGENSAEENSEASAADLEEFENVNTEIDNLNSILDTMESNVDNIKDQLQSILMSNREILKELKAENQKSAEAKEETPEASGNKPMDT